MKRKYEPLHLSRENLLMMYHVTYKPVGSGPLGCMKMICRLIEEIAEDKGIDLEISKEELGKLKNARANPSVTKTK